MTKTTEENLSQSKYAEHRNVTKGYIGRMVKEGRLHLIKGKLNVEMSDGLETVEQRLLQEARRIFGGQIVTEEFFNKHYKIRKVKRNGKKSRV